MRLYVIRHAQSANNALLAATGNEVGRVADPPLTELGHRQARALAACLAETYDEPADDRFAERHDRYGFGLTHLYTSLMIRAVETGMYVAEATGLPLVVWPEIHERGGLHTRHPEMNEEVGVPGPNRAYFEERHPKLLLPDSLGDAGWWNRPPETVAESYPRALTFWRQLLERHGESEHRVAVVTHGGFFQSLLRVMFDASPEPQTLGFEGVWFGITNASISRIEVNSPYAALRYMNRVDHLPSDLLTG